MKNKFQFYVMISIVTISGISQGMLLPVIAVIFEKEGVSAGLNGFHASVLYLGILAISPFLEKPLRRYGTKPMILIGCLAVWSSLFLFIFIKGFISWLVLRFLIGVGDHMLHVGSQTWITTSTDKSKMGRSLSIYGLFFSVGFAIGPILSNTLQFGEYVPFLISGICCFIGWLFVLPLKNSIPVSSEKDSSNRSSFNRYRLVLKYSWVAMLGPMVYGILEAMLNSNFPVFAMRSGFSIKDISFLLLGFTVGGIITQIPLGYLGDRFGRGKVLKVVLILSTCVFLTGSFTSQFYFIAIVLILTGTLLGSCFSLGLGYVNDLLSEDLIPAGNIITGMAFSIGSVSGPIIGGKVMELFPHLNFFISISVLIGIIAIIFALNSVSLKSVNKSEEQLKIGS
ncbi:MFS transporter [Bacillus sp. RG28]|uniref:MFS transporter n=1 Tax=Gottfriedia endophytica TaxID=2820819 RepID=A0A940NRT5_9BACI|nr:MFS transporter [Gottfriedia endophytica]MBP0725842.1 MFS transporter [Gottfriedia endophytica]